MVEDGISIPKESELKNNQTHSFKALFRIFFKTGRKRLLITTITGIILFIALTAFFVSWITYRYNFFYNSVGSNAWLNDGKISNNIIQYSEGPIDISPIYFENKVDETIEKLDAIVPKIGKENTAALYTQLYYFEINATERQDMKFMTFDNDTLNVLSDCLVEGRMPVSYDEIVFYRTNISIPFTLNQEITLGNNNSLTSHIYNYTIVGIVEDVENKFTQNSKSIDILRKVAKYDATDYDERLFTTYDLYVDNTGILVKYQGHTAFLIDFNYEFQPIHIRNTAKYLHNYYTELLDDYFWSIEGFCYDLFDAIEEFHDNWLNETLSIFSCGIPILLIFGLVCVETFKIDTHNLESKFKIMKIHGMEYKAIRRMVLLENFISTIISIVGGVLLGILVGYFIFLGIGNYGGKEFIFSLGEPVMLMALFILFLLFFIGGYLMENVLAKRTTKTTSQQYKKKRTKIFRKIITAQEFLLLLPGTAFIGIGLTGIIGSASIPNFSFLAQYYYDLMLNFWFITIIGFIFGLTAIFLFLSRVIAFIWGKIGKGIWNKTKSFITLSLKHISVNNKEYQRVIFAVLIIGLGIMPGIILKKSINDHVALESKLSVGYSDILIHDWSTTNDHLLDEISMIEGIEKTTKVKIYTLYYGLVPRGSDEFPIQIFSILNVTEFLEVINPQLFTDATFTFNDIMELDNNMNYLMSNKYAKKNNYDRGEIFVTDMFTNPYEEPFEMNYINTFNIFPLMNQFDRTLLRYSKKFGLVISEFTAFQILDYTSYHINIVTRSHILIKTFSDANVTNIQNELSNYNINSISLEEIDESQLSQISVFGLNLFVITSILTIIASIFIGYIAARNIYYQRLKIIESEYQLGAKRKQIWSSFTLELIFIIIVPTFLSFAIILPILKFLSSYFMYLSENHLIFHLWLPVWLFLLLICLIFATVIGGWLPEIIYLIRKYRPIKQE
ncbi:MAG: FtsX-like permease family protein [Asgard group archaeon]|nr:FtsX-like permease family protein [Asgard group archaeon]